MAKKKAPARKGGAKKCAPKKTVKRKPIPTQVVEQTTEKRLFLGKQALEMRGHGDCTDFTVAVVDRPAHPTVEEQFDSSDRYRYAIQPREERTLPAPPPPGPKSKFWRQYQDETGKFIGWRKALTKTKDQVISRLRLRKKPA